MKSAGSLMRLLGESINDKSLASKSLLALEAVISQAENPDYKPVNLAFINIPLFRELFQSVFYLHVSVEPVLPKDRPPYILPDAFSQAIRSSVRTLGDLLDQTYGDILRKEVGSVVMERLRHEIKDEVVCDVTCQELRSNLTNLLVCFCGVCRLGDVALAKNLRRLFSLVIESPIIGESKIELGTWLVLASS